MFTSKMFVGFLMSTLIMIFGVFQCVLAKDSQGEPQHVLTLENAVKLAISNDPWLKGYLHKQDALESMSVVAGELPDPKMSVGLANVPIDNFDFNQEGMTQFKLGISQSIPRGDSLSIKKRQLELLSDQFPYQRKNRKAKLSVMIGQLWLEIYKTQQTLKLIDDNYSLFQQLSDITQANYVNTIGKTRQQDIVRAQLELTRLDDRVTQLKQRKDVLTEKLKEWLVLVEDDRIIPAITNSITLPQALPNIKAALNGIYTSETNIDPQDLYVLISNHPSIQAVEQKIKAGKAGVELAKQSYKPALSLNANYGYRQNDPMNRERSDFFSLGVSFDLPIFTSNRQDKLVQAATSQRESIKTEKFQLIRSLMASFEENRSQLYRLNVRKKLYQIELLPQMHEQSEASLTAYTNDDGDFAEVVRSKISELNAEIESLSIDVDIQKTVIRMNYIFTKRVDDIVSLNSNHSVIKGKVK